MKHWLLAPSPGLESRFVRSSSVTYYWFTPTRTGTFEVLCAELCGAAHAQMRSKVIVEEEKDYHAWLEKQKTFA